MWDLSAMMTLEERRIESPGPSAEPGHGPDAILARGAHQDRGHPRDIDDVALQHAQRDPARHTGVDGIAARLEDSESRVRGEVVAGRGDMAGSGDRRPVRAGPGQGGILGHGALADLMRFNLQ
jgi:hypothetical protein